MVSRDASTLKFKKQFRARRYKKERLIIQSRNPSRNFKALIHKSLLFSCVIETRALSLSVDGERKFAKRRCDNVSILISLIRRWINLIARKVSLDTKVSEGSPDRCEIDRSPRILCL